MHFLSRLVGIAIILGIVFFQFSCRNDFEYSPYQTNLRFSEDTIYLDTVYTQYNSETYLLKVYNVQGEDIIVPSIELENEDESIINLNVDGQAGSSFNDVLIRSGDSLQIFIQTAVDEWPDNSPVYRDAIIFRNESLIQTVPLFASIEPVTFWKDDNLNITSNTAIMSGTSHFVIGELRVQNNATLSIPEDVTFYFYEDSGMSISEGSEVNIEGSMNSVVKFRTERNDARYDSLPGLWNGIQLETNALLNANYLWIQNAKTGIDLKENSEALLTNTQIYNSSNIGIHGFNSNITASNLIISNAAQACIAIDYGGEYDFYFTSLNNEWPGNISGATGSNIGIYLSDYNTENLTNPLVFNLYNSAVHSSYANSVYLDFNEELNANLIVESSVLENNNISEFNYVELNGFINNIYADPNFESTNFWNTNLSLKQDSPAKNFGNSAYNYLAPLDIRGIQRDATPNAGAFE